jgi:hypothetical protein
LLSMSGYFMLLHGKARRLAKVARNLCAPPMSLFFC